MSTTNLPPVKTDWKKLLPGLIISLTALVIILNLIDPDRLVSALQLADYRFVALSTLASLGWLMMRGVVWHTLLREKARYYDVFLTLNEGYLLNNILPFRLGEVGRALLLSRKSNLSFWGIVPTIVIERALDIAFAACLFLGSLPFAIGAAWASNIAILMGIAVTFGLGMLFLFARRQQQVANLIERLSQRSPLLQRLAQHTIPAFLNGLTILADGRLFLKAILWMVLNWGIAIIQIQLLLRAFFPEAQIHWGFFVLGSFALGIATPSTPGALGVFELVLVGAVSIFVNDPSRATAFALVNHLFNYLFTGVIGAYALSKEGQSMSSLFNNLYQRARRKV